MNAQSERQNLGEPVVLTESARPLEPLARFDCRATQESSVCLRLWSEFAPAMLMGTVLFCSGLFHLGWLWCMELEWEGPLSPRKPGLFGVSAGLTVWSITWVLTQLRSHHRDRRTARLIAGGLLLEVGLITTQYWRGIPSHFNRATILDATIESSMLVVILLVTVSIAGLCWRTRRLPPMTEASAIAIRAGMWLLLFSCGLGLLVAILGEINIANGRLPEIWGRAGVLKYPHGAALHAIQVLPLLAALLQRLRVANAARLLQSAVAAQVVFLSQAMWQTMAGRERLSINYASGAILAVAGLLLVLPCAAIIHRLAQIAMVTRSPNSRAESRD